MDYKTLENVLGQLRDPNKKTWILLSPSSLGETLTLCSLCDSFVKKHGYSITLVIPRGHEFITKCYPDLFYKIFFMTVDDMRLFWTYNLYPRNFFALDYPIITWSNQINETNPISLYELYIKTKGKQGLDFVNLNRFNLRLDWDCSVQLPSLPLQECNSTFERLKSEYNLKNDFVLLLYGNNTNKPIPSKYLNSICKEYEQQGVEVIANGYGASFKSKIDQFSNVKFIDLSIHEAVSVALYSRAIIGGSNGLTNLLTSLNLCKTIHIFLPNFILTDSAKLLFKKALPLEGAMTFACPELVSSSNTIKEYSVEEMPSNSQVATLARSIVVG